MHLAQQPGFPSTMPPFRISQPLQHTSALRVGERQALRRSSAVFLSKQHTMAVAGCLRCGSSALDLSPRRSGDDEQSESG